MTAENNKAALATVTARRNELFRESLPQWVERIALGTAWALRPPRHKNLPALAKLWAGNLIAPKSTLPRPEHDVADGLCGIANEISVPTLVNGYRSGLYPFAHIAPLKWWSPAQRSLLFFDEIHISKRLKRQMRQGKHTVTFDRAFEDVMVACADRRPAQFHLTWLTPRIMRAYADLFDAGHAHSFEVWNEAGQLVGGGYGVSSGGAFSTESQFTREANTSKMGFTVLHWHLARWGYLFSDGKRMTPTCADMGFRQVPRAEYLAVLAEAVKRPDKAGRWQVEADLATIADWQPAGEVKQAQAA